MVLALIGDGAAESLADSVFLSDRPADEAMKQLQADWGKGKDSVTASDWHFDVLLPVVCLLRPPLLPTNDSLNSILSLG